MRLERCLGGFRLLGFLKMLGVARVGGGIWRSLDSVFFYDLKDDQCGELRMWF